MPELPDIVGYLAGLGARILDQPIERARLQSPFLLRSVEPPFSAVTGRRVRGLERLGKRVVWELEGDLFAVFHLMIVGRFTWADAPAKPPGKSALVAFSFPTGQLILTEATSHKQASLHLVTGRSALAGHDRGGLEPLEADVDAFAATLRRENHTLKRALTDPRLFSGIGNAFGDEILHAARLSPVTLSRRLDEAGVARLHAACREVLGTWSQRLSEQFIRRFPRPQEVTAFRPEFAVHGKFGQPCPVCATPVQRIVHAENETNYCPGCQTGGRLLADRALSRLLGEDWPRTVEEWEATPGVKPAS